jgi:hypothetical protein
VRTPKDDIFHKELESKKNKMKKQKKEKTLHFLNNLWKKIQRHFQQDHNKFENRIWLWFYQNRKLLATLTNLMKNNNKNK